MLSIMFNHIPSQFRRNMQIEKWASVFSQRLSIIPIVKVNTLLVLSTTTTYFNRQNNQMLINLPLYCKMHKRAASADALETIRDSGSGFGFTSGSSSGAYQSETKAIHSSTEQRWKSPSKTQRSQSSTTRPQ